MSRGEAPKQADGAASRPPLRGIPRTPGPENFLNIRAENQSKQAETALRSSTRRGDGESFEKPVYKWVGTGYLDVPFDSHAEHLL